MPSDNLTIFFFSARIGFIGNGSHCEEPIRQGAGFLLLSQGVATVKIPFTGRPGIPISMASVSRLYAQLK